jgi:mRNA-degrading endonuclease RelE of RelBE toxin-antitoxin system
MRNLTPPLNLTWANQIAKDIEKMDASDVQKIVDGVIRFSQTLTPEAKPLRGSLKGLQRIRIESWRVIIRINVAESSVMAMEVEKRDKVYRRK